MVASTASSAAGEEAHERVSGSVRRSGSCVIIVLVKLTWATSSLKGRLKVCLFLTQTVAQPPGKEIKRDFLERQMLDTGRWMV